MRNEFDGPAERCEENLLAVVVDLRAPFSGRAFVPSATTMGRMVEAFASPARRLDAAVGLENRDGFGAASSSSKDMS